MFGIICDLDGTLYVHNGLDETFKQRFLEFLATQLSISIEEAKIVMNRDMQKDGSFEMDVLSKYSISIFDWFQFSNDCINPLCYISNDPILRDLICELYKKCWIDVATNTSFFLTTQILVALGIMEYIDHIWCADSPLVNNPTIYKPSSVLYNTILDYHHTPKDQVAIIGDRYRVDLYEAERIGIRHVYQVHQMEDTYRSLQSIASILI